MKYRRFGRMGWQVSEIGYGMWGMAGWMDSNDGDSKQAMQRAVDLGCNFFDTAWAYGDGKSEKMLGELMRANPSRRLYTATKIPPKNLRWPSRREYTVEDCYPPDHIEKYVESSLKNAGLESFDLMQLHVWEDPWLKDDRWHQSLEKLRRQGLFQGIGISLNRWESWNGVEAVRSGLVDAVQVIYNIFDQSGEDELFPACRERDVAIIARVPFDEGSLIGNLTLNSRWPQGDWRNTYFVPENLKATVEHVERLKTAAPSGMTLPEMALRFILSHPSVSTVIPGMRKVHHVEMNMAVSEAGPLPGSLLHELRRHRWDRAPTEWSQ